MTLGPKKEIMKWGWGRLWSYSAITARLGCIHLLAPNKPLFCPWYFLRCSKGGRDSYNSLVGTKILLWVGFPQSRSCVLKRRVGNETGKGRQAVSD